MHGMTINITTSDVGIERLPQVTCLQREVVSWLNLISKHVYELRLRSLLFRRGLGRTLGLLSVLRTVLHYRDLPYMVRGPLLHICWMLLQAFYPHAFMPWARPTQEQAHMHACISTWHLTGHTTHMYAHTHMHECMHACVYIHDMKHIQCNMAFKKAWLLQYMIKSGLSSLYTMSPSSFCSVLSLHARAHIDLHVHTSVCHLQYVFALTLNIHIHVHVHCMSTCIVAFPWLISLTCHWHVSILCGESSMHISSQAAWSGN